MSTPDQSRRYRALKSAGTYEPQRRAERLPWPRNEEDGTPRGVDLSVHWEEVRGYLRRYVRVPSYMSREDFEAEFALALVARNHMPSAHDPRRTNLRGYIYRLANNLLFNAIKKHRLTASRLTRDDGADAEALPDTSETSWRDDAIREVRELQARGRLSPVATGYCLEALTGGDTSPWGSAWIRRGLREELRGALGVVGP